MPLEGKAKTEYQREYMRRYRADQAKKQRRRAAADVELPPTPAVKISIDELRDSIQDNPIHSGMRKYTSALRLMLDDVVEPLMFCGGVPGIGKTYELIKACEAAGLRPGNDWDFAAPGTDPHSLVQEVWDKAHFKLICFDDHDKLLRAPVAQEIIKSGWGPQRRIRWGTKASKGEKATHPPAFDVNSRLVWLSNCDPTETTDVNLAAIFDRGISRNIRGTDMDVFRYAVSKAVHGDFARDYPLAVKHEAIQWFNRERNRIESPSLRTLQKALIYIHRARSETEKQEALDLLLAPRDKRSIPGFDAAEISRAISEQEPLRPRLTAAE